MLVFEISNLTMNEKNKLQYLVTPTSSNSDGKKIYYPVDFPRLERIWVSKNITTYTVEKLLSFIDILGGQEEYDALTEVRSDTIYRIWEDGEIVTLYFNRKAYGTGSAPALIGDATIFISDKGAIISDILSSDTKVVVDSMSISTVNNATKTDIDDSMITYVDPV